MRLLRITIDTNCLIDAEQRSQSGLEILALNTLAESGIVDLLIPGIAASENPRKPYSSFSDFEQRIRDAGLSAARVIRPMAYVGISFVGYSVIPSDDMKTLETRIHQALFPSLPFDCADFCRRKDIDPNLVPIDRGWRNTKCDVLVAWSHIHHQGDLLVTSDENFHDRRAELIALGARDLARPHEAQGRVSSRM